jgi:cell division septation protein DedD
MRPVEPVATKPTPAAARPAPGHPGGGGWRVQLGAFSSEANARHLWESLNPHVPSLRGGHPYLVHAGAVTRLQAGSFASSAEAAQACAEVKRAGNACLPVAP